MYPKTPDQRHFVHDLMGVLLTVPPWFFIAWRWDVWWPLIPGIFFGFAWWAWWFWNDHLVNWLDPELTPEDLSVIQIRRLFGSDFEKFRKDVEKWLIEQEKRLDSKYGGPK